MKVFTLNINQTRFKITPYDNIKINKLSPKLGPKLGARGDSLSCLTPRPAQHHQHQQQQQQQQQQQHVLI